MSRLIDADVLLEELKTWGGSVEALHEYIENMPTVCDDFTEDLLNQGYTKGYNKAIDDFSEQLREELNKHSEKARPVGWVHSCEILTLTNTINSIIDISEQMKGGEKNG